MQNKWSTIIEDNKISVVTVNVMIWAPVESQPTCVQYCCCYWPVEGVECPLHIQLLSASARALHESSDL